jgi:hypothetical protein
MMSMKPMARSRALRVLAAVAGLCLSACVPFKPHLGMSYDDFYDMSYYSLRGKPEAVDHRGSGDIIVQVDNQVRNKVHHGINYHPQDDVYYEFKDGRLTSVMNAHQYRNLLANQRAKPAYADPALDAGGQ